MEEKDDEIVEECEEDKIYSSMSKKELVAHLKNMDNLIKWWSIRKGQICRFVRRDYKEFKGVLLNIFFSIDSFVFGITDEEHDYVNNTITEEDRVINIKANNIVDVEFIMDSRTRKR